MQIVLAHAHSHGAAGTFARCIGREQHRPADGVAAEQRALRSAQDLYVRNIAEVHGAADRASHVHLVDVDTDAGIDRGRRIGLTDAANENLRGGVVAGERPVRVELQIRRDLVQVRRRSDLLALERLCAQRGDSDRRVLQRLFAAPRRNDDRFEDLDARCLSGLGRRLSGRARRRA